MPANTMISAASTARRSKEASCSKLSRSSALPAETAGDTAAQAGSTEFAALAPALPAGTPKQQYDYAYDVLKQAVQQQGDFDEARRAFDAFIENHPDDDGIRRYRRPCCRCVKRRGPWQSIPGEYS